MNISIIWMIIRGLIYLFIPGFVWSYVFWKKITIIERIIFSFLLTLLIIPVSVFFINYFKNGFILSHNLYLVEIPWIIIGLFMIFLKTNKKLNKFFNIKLNG